MEHKGWIIVTTESGTVIWKGDEKLEFPTVDEAIEWIDEQE